MNKTFVHIKELIQVRDLSVNKVSGSEMSLLPTIPNAFLRVKDGIIVDYGSMNDFSPMNHGELIDVSDQMILPCWCDSHTHVVYAGNRIGEFVDRIHGLTYQEIANRGGGILNSARLLQQTSEEELYIQSKIVWRKS